MNEALKNIAEKFIDLFGTRDAFVKSKPEEIESLKGLSGDKVSSFIDFYKDYNPNNVKMTDSYVSLLDIEHILIENTDAEPGKFLSKLGLIVFATTIGGNPVCIDSKAATNGDAPVYICDIDFCNYNEALDMVEIGWPSAKLSKKLEGDDSTIELTYENAVLCMKTVEESFITFMKKLSENDYDDLEEFFSED